MKQSTNRYSKSHLLATLLASLLVTTLFFQAACQRKAEAPEEPAAEEVSAEHAAPEKPTDDDRQPVIQQNDTPELPSYTRPEGTPIVLSDSEMGLRITIVNPDWTYMKDPGTGQLYIVNPALVQSGCLITITAISFTVPLDDATVAQLWDMMKLGFGSFEIITYDTEEITVGGTFAGYLIPFDLGQDGVYANCGLVMFSTGEIVYMCTYTSLPECLEEVHDVFDNMLDSFEVYEVPTP
ncbi:MAG: hypothetical protein FWD45_03995 [Coriobacteriia bacterium]|nr:hypothetical protein [Coriobacteriia bacterium]